MGTLPSRLLPGALIIATDDRSSLLSVLPQTQVRMCGDWLASCAEFIM